MIKNKDFWSRVRRDQDETSKIASNPLMRLASPDLVGVVGLGAVASVAGGLELGT